MENIMDIEKLKQQLEKIEMYKKMEELNFNNIKDEFKNISYSYNTNYKKKIENLCTEFENKLNIIIKKQNNHIIFINKNITKYEETSLKVNNLFNNI